MAGADTAKVKALIKNIDVPDELVNGSKFLKWEEDSSNVVPVTLKVDPKGFFLYWKDQAKDVECLELSHLRDARNGKYAMVPKDGKVRDTCTMGNQDDNLEDKALTVVTGDDMVNLSFLNFYSNNKAIAQQWANELVRISYSPTGQNPSRAQLLEKMYTKLTILVNREGKIPIKSLKKMFGSSREDKKKVENALQAAGIHVGPTDTSIDPKKFSFSNFFTFYLRLVHERDIDSVFQELGAKNKPYLTTTQLVKFLNDEQRDPRLNEILYPYHTEKDAFDIIHEFETNKAFIRKGHLSTEGLARYLMDHKNSVVPPESYILWQDMDQPLSHYFINSSHNTYLTGHQFTGKSSVEIYRQVLLTGCRCIELDCWDGQDGEPMITHGKTLCTEVSFKEVIEAINESAFKTSDYPLILSFENHCTQKFQAKMAYYCRTIFGDLLQIDTVDEYPTEPGMSLPTPQILWRKILVKNKKRKVTDATKKRAVSRRLTSVSSISSGDSFDLGSGESSKLTFGASRRASKKAKLRQISETTYDQPDIPEEALSTAPKKASSGDAQANTEDPKEAATPNKNQDTNTDSTGGKAPSSDLAESSLKPSETVEEEDEDSDSDSEEDNRVEIKKEQGTAGQEAEAGAEMSALVNYLQPCHFHSFEVAEKNNKAYEISSFVETSAMNKVKEKPTEFVHYNKRQLSRIYPRGTRVESSNYMPQIFWNVGCQLVALNFQSLDLPMQLNLATFELNGRSGYLIKPEFMRRKDRYFDPFAETTMDGVVAANVEIRIISGQFLSDKKIGTYVEVDMFGLPADTVRKRHKTKIISGNGLNPVYEDKPFIFKQLIMPKLAMMKIAVFGDNNKLIGHRFLPVETIRPGYRHICLRNESNQALMLPSLFVQIEVRDYVPDNFADFATALSNPIAYLSQIEKRGEQLKALELEEEENCITEIADGTKLTPAKDTLIEKATTDGGTPAPATTTPATLPSATGTPVKMVGTPAVAASSTGSTNSLPLPYIKKASTMTAVHPTVNKDVAVKSETSGISSSSSTSLGRENSGGLPRSFSLGNSQFEAIGGSSLGSNSRSQSAPNLYQAEEIEPATVDDVNNMKKCLSLIQQQSKELDKLIKKHEKRQSKVKKSQTKELNKLKMSHLKAVKSQQKKNNSQEKKVAKKNQNELEKVKRHSVSSLEALKKKQEDEILKKQVHQEDCLIQLYKKHYDEEKVLRVEHARITFEQKVYLLSTLHEKQIKKLEQQQKKEEANMRKMLETQSADLRKKISRGDVEKQEIQRLKGEAKQKHIQQAVMARKELRNRQTNEKEELKQKMNELQEELIRTADVHVKTVEKEYEKRYKKLNEDRKYQRLEKNGTHNVPNEVDGAQGDANGEVSGEFNGGIGTEDNHTPNIHEVATLPKKENGVSTTQVDVHQTFGSPQKVANTNGIAKDATTSPVDKSAKASSSGGPKKANVINRVDAKEIGGPTKESPKKKHSGPKQQQGSPKKVQSNPKQQPGGPKKEQSSPKRQPGSPKKEQSSPKQHPGSPKKEQSSPKKEQSSPKRQPGSPKKEQSSPNHQQGNPKKDQGSPKKGGGSPKKSNGSPKKTNGVTSPAEVKPPEGTKL